LLGIDKISEEESFATTFRIIPFIGGMANCFHRRSSTGIVSRLSVFTARKAINRAPHKKKWFFTRRIPFFHLISNLPKKVKLSFPFYK
jgi:hypothetical protein